MLSEDLGLHQVKFTFEIHSTGELSKFLVCVYGLAYDEKPKYQELKKILLDGLEMSGIPYDGPLEFSTAKASKVSKRVWELFLKSPA